MANKVKVSRDEWISCAKNALIEEGLSGVKVDRLAKTLGVSRGGFYHNFENLKDLLDALIQHWVAHNDLVPASIKASTPGEALSGLQHLVVHVIEEKEFTPAFELAVREWARVDPKAKAAVETVDQLRIERLTDLFQALGCDAEEAPIRARVLYFHQFGFYSLGYHELQSSQDRINAASVYLRILCGRRYIEAAEKDLQKWA